MYCSQEEVAAPLDISVEELQHADLQRQVFLSSLKKNAKRKLFLICRTFKMFSMLEQFRSRRWKSRIETPTLSFAIAGGCFRTSFTVWMTVSVRMALTERTSSTSRSCSSLAKGITWNTQGERSYIDIKNTRNLKFSISCWTANLISDRSLDLLPLIPNICNCCHEVCAMVHGNWTQELHNLLPEVL